MSFNRANWDNDAVYVFWSFSSQSNKTTKLFITTNFSNYEQMLSYIQKCVML